MQELQVLWFERDERVRQWRKAEERLKKEQGDKEFEENGEGG